MLAAWRALGAESVAHILAVQATLGALAVVFLADATRRLAGGLAGLMAGVLLAFFQTTTFFDGLLLPESLLFFLESLLVWFVIRTDWAAAGGPRYAAGGLLIGVLAQGRASHAVLLLPVLWLARYRKPRPALPAVAWALAAFAAATLPSTLANLRASGELIPFTYNPGFNLRVGNNPGADGGYVDVTGGSIPVPLEGTPSTTGGALDGRAFVLATEGRRLNPAESSTYWTRKAAAFVAGEPLRALGLAGRKLLLAWNQEDVPQIERIDSFARAAGPLGLPVLGSFGFLAFLGLSGLAAAARHGPAGRWLLLYLALMSLAMAPFFVTDRYRHHLVPALAVLAGISMARIAGTIRRPNPASLTGTGLAMGLAAAVVLAPIGSGKSRLDDWTYTVDEAMRQLDRGDHAGAARGFARAEMSLDPAPRAALSASARTDLAAFYFRYGTALESLGRSDEAVARWERAVDLNPNDARSLGRLSLAYERAGRTEDQARVRRRLESVPGGRGQLHVNDGWAAAGRGDLAGAEKLFIDAVRASPDLSVAWEGLIRIRIQTGRFEEASRALDEARGSGLDQMPADIYEAFLTVRKGDPARARRVLDRISGGPVPSDPVLARLLEQARRESGAQER